jgi:hypothetical protein
VGAGKDWQTAQYLQARWQKAILEGFSDISEGIHVFC